jgi:hypothetical protein
VKAKKKTTGYVFWSNIFRIMYVKVFTCFSYGL